MLIEIPSELLPLICECFFIFLFWLFNGNTFNELNTNLGGLMFVVSVVGFIASVCYYAVLLFSNVHVVIT